MYQYLQKYQAEMNGGAGMCLLSRARGHSRGAMEMPLSSKACSVLKIQQQSTHGCKKPIHA